VIDRLRFRPLLIATLVGFLLGSGIPGADAPIALAPDQAGVFSALTTRSALAGPSAALPPFTFRLPSAMDRSTPATVLLLLHGMNASGSEMMSSFADEADRNGWILLAPQLRYRDWTDPEQVKRDESELLPALRALLDSAPESIGMRLKPKAVVFGFSRGAQLAERFALAYPDSVKAVVTASAGTIRGNSRFSSHMGLLTWLATPAILLISRPLRTFRFMSRWERRTRAARTYRASGTDIWVPLAWSEHNPLSRP
jgi:pimeloyl-ACP methyl ester carboxylesterase